ncbi:MAG: hypothetical protein EA393_13975 [Bacteroidetes bacterium]|nr:MAG: hypothetical protein EA393_13975 [Bacteroidota bacterium]
MNDPKIMLQETEEVQAQKLQATLTTKEGRNQLLCKIWESKLKAVPWFDGKDQNVQGLLQQKQYFFQAKELMTKFEKINFPGRICYSLESIARDLQLRIFTFPYNFNKTANFLAEELTRTIEERIELLNSNPDQIIDPDRKPYIIDKNELLELLHHADELKLLFAEDSGQLESLTNILNRLKELIKNPAMD